MPTKFLRWTDPESGQDPDAIFGMDRLLTAVIIYLLSDSLGSSIWAYLGLYTDPQRLEPGQRIEIPVGHAHFADPPLPTPQLRRADLQHHAVDGHAPGRALWAFEQPQLVREDVRKLLCLIRER